MGEELTGLSLAEAITAVRRRDVSPLELVDASLELLERRQPDLQAFVAWDPDRVRAEARVVGAGRRWGSLAGVPLGIKDTIDVVGYPTRDGAPERIRLPGRDADAVDRLRRQGAVILGKTTTHELAYGGVCAPTRNAVDQRHIAGGSSGGSAVAVAGHLCFGALGTDTGGSIRIPASYNGVVGLKPTYARVPTQGVTPLSWSLDHVGPIARTVEDVTLLLAALSGPGRQHEAGGLAGDVRGLRIASPPAYFRTDVDEQVLAATRETCRRLALAGATVVDVDLDDLGPVALAYRSIVASEATAAHLGDLLARPDQFGPAVRAKLERGATIPAIQYVNAIRFRNMLTSRFRDLFAGAGLDAMVLPATPTPAPRADELSKADEDADPEGLLARQLRLGAPFNMTGMPVVTLRSAVDASGLPLGVAIAGRPSQDGLVLRVARAVERDRDRLD